MGDEGALDGRADLPVASGGGVGREPALDDPGTLQWSVTAMGEATMRLALCRTVDGAQALAAVGEAVWRVTITDARLVRRHPDAYGEVLAGHDLVGGELVEGTLAGLRFVRNRMDAGPGGA